MAVKGKEEKRVRRHLRVRKKVVGTPERPRLCVFRSLNHIYAQVVDDTARVTLAFASSNEPAFRETHKSGGNIAAAQAVGKMIAQRALDKGIKQVVFDRGGYLYHGRVKALADAAREGGLDF
ncbi:MAG TPA: 50S ribosomal protein L18 [Firmicutes bacterium]|nr:50S ribosomal protein L18 [Candidatus Fermentithermobacillaceae bacterium]